MFSATLFYRSAGESKFATKPMKWRYKELVGRIPAAKMTGSAIQYYVEVKDATGEVVTRSGNTPCVIRFCRVSSLGAMYRSTSGSAQ